MAAAKKRRQEKICFLRIREQTVEILTDPERFDGKHGVALTLYLALLTQAVHQEKPEYLFPDGNWESFLRALHERYRWPEETIDAALRMLCRNGLLENHRSRLTFPGTEHVFGSEWPSAASMRKRRRLQAEERSRSASGHSGAADRLTQLKRKVHLRGKGKAEPLQKAQR